MPDPQDYLSAANLGFLEAKYARWKADPSQVEPEYRALFFRLEQGEPSPRAAAPSAMALQARADQVVYAYRLRGHLLAKLDPLELPSAKPSPTELGLLSAEDFRAEELATPVDPSDVFPRGPVLLRELLERLARTYCRSVGPETMQVQDQERRRWLLQRMEWSENRPVLSAEEQRWILERLSASQAFETVAHSRFVGAKRFSLEGAESLIPLIDALLEVGGGLGLREVVIGMAHRGRLNVLVNVLGKSGDEMFSEFVGPPDVRSFLGRGDVKYHLGYSAQVTTRAQVPIHLSLAFNPSHLEAVYPVVEGRVRAKLDRAGDGLGTSCLPLVLHGDASFVAQGVVAETLNLAELPAYFTGGTVHLVVNNQIGFTTEASQGRSMRTSTSIARLLGIPIFHVNGDDPEACIQVARLAAEYRQRFHSDVVVDLVCYRRWGHNETDEPAFTQPVMYEKVRTHPPVRERYAGQLLAQQRLRPEEVEEIWSKAKERFQAAQERAKQAPQVKEPSFNQGLWANYRGGPDGEAPEADTGVERPVLTSLAQKLSSVPEGFSPHPKVARLQELRKEMGEGMRPLDWAMAELLALGSLLQEGHSVRLTGQDTERGTFSQRHAVLHDVKTGETHCPLCALTELQGRCLVANSPLSEEGCVGFELGYSFDYPDALVAWEAQYGDFINTAQVMLDQFLASSEDKWRRLSGLALLLPHGFEGQGPEHSSARLERFLQLCAEDNLQVCVPTTPAQYFHLLRRQVLRPYRKPLVVMTPKSLLRLGAATSTLDQLAQGRFQRVLRDRPEVEASAVTRLVLCTGKLFYELAAARDERKDWTVALVRLEQLYPFPAQAVGALLQGLPRLSELCWAQEEPHNAGAWRFVEEQLSRLPSRPKPRYIGRPESASPATGVHGAHVLEQRLIIEEAITRG